MASDGISCVRRKRGRGARGRGETKREREHASVSRREDVVENVAAASLLFALVSVFVRAGPV